VATGAVVPDVVAADLAVLFCGINPGRWSGAVGHHFAHPGNRFWKALCLAGYTDRLLAPAEERVLLEARLGITNLVARTTATAAELSPGELRRGGEELVRKVGLLQPRAVAFLGLGAFRTAFGVGASPGRQEGSIGTAIVWVLPNPSGLQAHYGLEDLVAELTALQEALVS
jgi:double-stranded uracil-DNA glycosylase